MPFVQLFNFTFILFLLPLILEIRLEWRDEKNKLLTQPPPREKVFFSEILNRIFYHKRQGFQQFSSIDSV